jgi:hypothetical protein
MKWIVLRVPRNMKTAVYNGLLAPDTYALPSPPFSCPGGNCTWDPFPTLAVGVQCRDAPESYKLSCSKHSFYDSEACAVVVIRDSNRDIHFSEKSETGENPDIVFHLAEAGASGKFGLNSSLWTVPNGQRTDIDWIRVTNLRVLNDTTISGTSTSSYIVRNSTIESRQCILYTCLHEISARVENGVYSETTQEFIRGTESLQESPQNTNTYFSYENKNGSVANITVTYAEQEALMSAIQAPFEEFLNEEIGWGSFPFNSNLSSGRGDYLRRTDMMTTLYLTPNLTETMHAVTHYMNIALRSMNTFADFQTSFSNNTKLPKDYISPKERVVGRVWVDVIHIRVRWPWLILPAILMLIAFALLAATILETWSQRVSTWKENPLALLLFSKFDDQQKPAIEHAQNEKDIERVAKGLHVQLTTNTNASDNDIKSIFSVRRNSNF